MPKIYCIGCGVEIEGAPAAVDETGEPYCEDCYDHELEESS